MTNPSNLGVAEIRRSIEVERITKSMAMIWREIGQGVNDANGISSLYKAERREWLIGERDRLREVIAELGNLSPEDLVEKYVPEAKPVEATPMREALGRGEYGPRQRVVHRDPPPTYRIGGNPAPVYPTNAPPGVTYTYRDGELVAV